MVFWSRGLGNTTPQMFVVEGQGEAIWRSFAEKILDVVNVEIAELQTWTRYLERDELELANHDGRLVFGMEPDPKIRQWITISNRPGKTFDLDHHGAPIH